jgi:hypothetical protein
MIYDIPWEGDCYFFSSAIWYPPLMGYHKSEEKK